MPAPIVRRFALAHTPPQFALGPAVPFDTYMAATALGIVPGSFFYTFLGSGIGNIEGFIAGTEKADPETVALSIVGWVMAVVAFVAIFRYAKRRLAAQGLDSIVEQREDTVAEVVEEDVEGGEITHRSASRQLSDGLLARH
jgi:hypothetical protein